MKTKFLLAQTFVCFISLATVLTGCAFHQPRGTAFTSPASPKAGKALIYFYRPPGESFGYNRTYSLLANDRRVADLLHGGYYPYDADAGHIRLISDVNATFDRILGLGLVGSALESEFGPDAARLDFNVQIGQVYYVKFQPETHFTHFTPKLFLVTNSIGESEIKSCKLNYDKKSK